MAYKRKRKVNTSKIADVASGNISVVKSEDGHADYYLHRIYLRTGILTPEEFLVYYYFYLNSSGWKFNIKSLCNTLNMGRGKAYRTLRSLDSKGFVKRTSYRTDDNFLGYSYTVYDLPDSIKEEMKTYLSPNKSAKEKEPGYEKIEDIPEELFIKWDENDRVNIPFPCVG